MSDRDRMLDLLRERGSRGATTLEMRRMGLSGNPSQRRSELLDRGYAIAVHPYKEGRRRGRRYVLVSEPACAEPTAVTTRREGAGGNSGGLGAEECSQTRAPASSDETNDGRFPSGGEGSGALFGQDEFKPRRQHDQEAA